MFDFFIFRTKGYEILYETFPQVILGAFTIQALQLWEPLNILSFVFSLVSLLYGIGEQIAIRFYGDVEADILTVMFGILTVMTDAVLRVLFFSYLLTIAKAYTLLIVLVYLLMTFAKVWKSTARVELETAFRLFVSLNSSLYSLPCSAFQSKGLHSVNMRSMSKGFFSLLFVLSFAFVFVSTNTLVLNDIGFALQNSSKIENSAMINCTNICNNEFNEFCSQRWKYLPQSEHLIIQSVLGFFFLLSLLEWILESNFDSMPYRQLRKIVCKVNQKNQPDNWRRKHGADTSIFSRSIFSN